MTTQDTTAGLDPKALDAAKKAYKAAWVGNRPGGRDGDNSLAIAIRAYLSALISPVVPEGEAIDDGYELAETVHGEIVWIVKRHNPLKEPIALAPATPVEGLSEWCGWDQSNLPWSESHHKDDVLAALFRGPWSMEDCAMLISFIDRTWTRIAALARSEP